MHHMISYYDPFDIEEEEDFLASEQERIEKEVDAFVKRLNHHQHHDDHVDMDEDASVSNCISSNAFLSSCTLDFTLQPHHLIRIVDTVLQQSTENSTHLQRHASSSVLSSLSFRHWGLANRGIPQLCRLWTSSNNASVATLQHLSLASCGLTSPGLQLLLHTLTDQSSSAAMTPSLQQLDLRRNNFRSDSTTVSQLFRFYIPKLQSLKYLDVSACSLTITSIQALMEGLIHCGNSSNASPCPLQHVDISDNIDTLLLLLEGILERSLLARLVQHNTTLQQLILVRTSCTSSSTTCIDAQHYVNSATILEQVALQLTLPQQHNIHDTSNNNYQSPSLTCLGHLSLLHMDRASEDATSLLPLQRHTQCQRALERIHLALQVHLTQPSLRTIIANEQGPLLSFALAAVQQLDTTSAAAAAHQTSHTTDPTKPWPLTILKQTSSSVSSSWRNHHFPSLLYFWTRETLPVIFHSQHDKDYAKNRTPQYARNQQNRPYKTHILPT